MGYYREAEIPALLRDFGVDVTLGASTVRGVVDQTDEGTLQGSGPAAMIEESIVVTVQTGSLPGLAVGSSITVGGDAYVVRDRRKIGDGALTALYCEAA